MLLLFNFSLSHSHKGREIQTMIVCISRPLGFGYVTETLNKRNVVSPDQRQVHLTGWSFPLVAPRAQTCKT